MKTILMLALMLTPLVVQVIGDILDQDNPTIGFNRADKAIDATFELDLRVADTFGDDTRKTPTQIFR